MEKFIMIGDQFQTKMIDCDLMKFKSNLYTFILDKSICYGFMYL